MTYELIVLCQYWDVVGADYTFRTATERFNMAKSEAMLRMPYRADQLAKVDATTFFAEKKRRDTRERRVSAGRRLSGDFDDMGNGSIERQYRHEQKRRRGRF